MIRAALVATILAQQDPNSRRANEALMHLTDENIGNHFSTYARRLSVTLSRKDYLHVAGSQQVHQLEECAQYFYSESNKKVNHTENVEPGFFLLATNSTTILDDSKDYLNCKTPPCYSIEIDEHDDAENSAQDKAYTKPIDMDSSGIDSFNFVASCKNFVDEYTRGEADGTLTYFIAEEVSDYADELPDTPYKDDEFDEEPPHYAPEEPAPKIDDPRAQDNTREERISEAADSEIHKRSEHSKKFLDTI